MRPRGLLLSSSTRPAARVARPTDGCTRPCTCRALTTPRSRPSATPRAEEREMTTTPTPMPTPTARERLASAAAALSLALAATLAPICPAHAADVALVPPPPPAATEATTTTTTTTTTTSSGSFVADGARMLTGGDEERRRLSARLERLARDTGWRLRVVTVDGLSARGGREAARAALSLPSYSSSLPSFDRRTIVLQADPSAPALLSAPYVGDDALRDLGRPFFSELLSRFGNQFYVRENGSSKALRDAVGALELCLSRETPCRVVPGLPDDQLSACVTFAIAGGIVAGGASKIKGGSGPLQWVLLFAPLWFSLVASFGVGPIVSRLGPGEREAPVAAVLGAFAGAALLPWAPEALGTRRPPAPPPGEDGA